MSNNLCELIKTARLEAGFTQEQLAEFTGVSRGTVSRWESDNPDERVAPQILNLKEIAEVTKVPFGEFIRCMINEKVAKELGEDIEIDNSQKDDYTVKLWERIRAARINAKMTQEDLAKACGVSRATVNSWESPKNKHKKTRRQSLRRIAEVTNTSIEWLISTDELDIDTATRVTKSESAIKRSLQKEADKRKSDARKLLMESYAYVTDHGISPELYDILKGLSSSLKRYHK